jgi:septin family protein
MKYDSGYGNYADVGQSISLVKNEIVRRLRNHNPIFSVHDERVDIVLFFIPPHRLKEMDVLFIKAISEVTSVILVVGKVQSNSITLCVLHDSSKDGPSLFVCLQFTHRLIR